jgi:hypothetical protein
MTFNHDELEGVVVATCPVEDSVQHMGSMAAEPFYELGTLGYKLCMVEKEGEAWLGDHTQLGTHSHKDCTVVGGMIIGKGIHMVVVDGSDHAYVWD